MRQDLADMEFVPRGLFSIQPGRGCKPPLRDWLVERGLLREGQVKPDRPKEAFWPPCRRPVSLAPISCTNNWRRMCP